MRFVLGEVFQLLDSEVFFFSRFHQKLSCFYLVEIRGSFMINGTDLNNVVLAIEFILNFIKLV